MSALTRHGPGNLCTPTTPQASADIAGTAQALISGQQFVTREYLTLTREQHDFDSLMQFIYGSSDSDDLESCIQAVAMGSESAAFATKRMEAIIQQAAEQYVAGWIHKLEEETNEPESEPFVGVRGAV